MCSDETRFRVVVNASAQLGIWPIGRPPPRGWQVTAMAGAVRRCQDFIDQIPPAGARELAHARQPGPGPAASSRSIVELFDRTARAAATVLVLHEAGRQLTLGELRSRSVAVADELSGIGVGGGDRVAVCHPVGIDFVVAMLGVLRAGGICVPVDVEASIERRDAILSDAGVSAILAGGRPRRFDSGPAGEFAWQPQPGDALVVYPSDVGPDPVGVVWRHSQLRGLAVGEPAGVFDGGSVLVRHRPDDGLLLLELVWSFGTAASAVIFDDTTSATGGRRPRASTGAPDIAFSAAPIDHPGERRTLLWRGGTAGAPVQLWGLGDSTVVATGASADGPGRPLPGVRFLVLDHDLTMVPTGATGRLHVAGWPVGGGYLGRPGLTAQRLIPDPSGPPGSRMVDTGIVVRRRTRDLVTFG
ncbi:AMP-binding protein [Solwaraspora sp. WMMD406]|uniref:AMP-binding protein n=1 Tax=Solwaraspora sp. WMMD406 TaxID=3016095 RepID=UPI00241689DA|nr:AMP-binding protein [Solwaraspora sp. WMMD406]MDG4765750.1 AMP-binding protein [Solwaraspora sp. WMMD406]